MCRRKELYGCCMAAFGLGLILGNWIHSWFWCICGGIVIIVLGLSTMQRR